MTGQLKFNVKNLKLGIYIGRIYILSIYILRGLHRYLMYLRGLQPITDL